MTMHSLKIWPQFFDDVASGRKQFEYRRDDRAQSFKVGDVLHLQEYKPALGTFTDRSVKVEITYIQRATKHGHAIGIPIGFCIMGIKLVEGA
jgi:hypothetical protein